MPLLFTVLVLCLFCADQSFDLSKVNRAGNFLIILELKNTNSLTGVTNFSVVLSILGSFMGHPPFELSAVTLFLLNKCFIYKKLKKKKKKKITVLGK
jgi:hypothetical protein